MNGYKCNIVGKSFRSLAARLSLNNSSSGTKMTLVRDPDNLHDSNAIKVFIADEEGDDEYLPQNQVGFIDKYQAAKLSAIMDREWVDEADAVLTSPGRWESPTLELLV